MADAIDMASAAEAELIAHGLARVDPAIPEGNPGECDDCGEWMPRLVLGRCGFCRDGRVPPAEFYDRPTQTPASTEENDAMTAKVSTQSRVISMPASGDVLDAIEMRAEERDLPLGQAARSFIEDAISTIVVAQPAGAPHEWDGTKAGAAVFFANVPDAWLIEEVSNRLNTGIGSDDYEVAVTRADTAEARLAQLRELLSN